MEYPDRRRFTHEVVRKALEDALARGQLSPEEPGRGAVGTLIQAITGYRNDAWYALVLSWRRGLWDEREEAEFRMIEQAVGLPLLCLYLIESAFEGKPMDHPGPMIGTLEEGVERVCELCSSTVFRVFSNSLTR